jgi:hypothetical protein
MKKLSLAAMIFFAFFTTTVFGQTNDQMNIVVLSKQTSFKELREAGTITFCSKDECDSFIKSAVSADKEEHKRKILSRKTINLLFYRDGGMLFETLVVYNLYYKDWRTYTLDLLPEEIWESKTRVITPKASECKLN